jgi:hypothetical protein
MKRYPRITMLVGTSLLLVATLLGQTANHKVAPPQINLDKKRPIVLTTQDRQTINSYYEHVIGSLAPGSINRTPFSLEVEKALVKGSKVPMNLEQQLEPLPPDLESQLSLLTGDHKRYKLGWHVLVVRLSDLTIADVLKDAGWANDPR